MPNRSLPIVLDHVDDLYVAIGDRLRAFQPLGYTRVLTKRASTPKINVCEVSVYVQRDDGDKRIVWTGFEDRRSLDTMPAAIVDAMVYLAKEV